MPRKLFETDGIRGTANVYPMTPETALRVGKAVAYYFKKQNGGKRHFICIGKDTRLSGYMFETALTSGIVSMGVNVFLVGPMPTAAIAHLTKTMNCDAGIVLSASHNPAEDNGIKIFDSQGYKLNDEVEEEIEKLIFSEELKDDTVKGNAIGKAYRIDDARGRYIEFLKNTVELDLEGLKIVVDCANGAAYRIAPYVFAELGAEVVEIGTEPDGLNINKGCGALHPELLQKAVREHKADLGIALDGDADRVIFCDERGELVDGNKILAVLALDLKKKNRLEGNTVVATVMANAGFLQAMDKAKIKVEKVPVGDRYIIEGVRKGNFSLGGEPNGHIIFPRYLTTDDGILAALQLLEVLKKSGKKLSELASCMEVFPEKLVNVIVKEKKPFEQMPAVQKKIIEAEKQLDGKGSVLVRYSGTENLARVHVQAQSEAEAERISQEIAEEIKKEIGK